MATYYVAPYGNNSNNGTSTTTPWATPAFALGVASGTNPGLAAGDTVWIAPGTYRGTITYGGASGTSGNTVKIYGDPTFTRNWTSGSVGAVRITNYIVDTTNPTAAVTMTVTADYIDIQDLYINGYTTAVVASGGVLKMTGGNLSVLRCVITSNTESTNSGLVFILPDGKNNISINRCSIYSAYCIFVTVNTQTTAPHNANISIIDSICLYENVGGFISGATANQFTGISSYNSMYLGNGQAAFVFTNPAIASGTSNIFRNNVFTGGTGRGIWNNNASTMTVTQTNNVVIAATPFTNILPTTNTIAATPVLDYGASRMQGFSTLPWYAPATGSPLIGAGSTTGAPLVDFYNNTWTGNPTVGAVESKIESDNSQYFPTERNASAITIAPASTSQSIELYLGVTGLTFATSGLAAYYVRNREAPTPITLVTQTPTGAWTSGGFAEISSSLVPGVYRLDVPNAAFAAGASDVTIVVRGASGTNGAVLTVTLSSGGLTAAQTAAAVWDEPYTSHTTASTFGARTLKTTVDNRPVDVGTSFHIQANVHAIVDSTAAASELSGALLHNGTDYISADLLTPVSAATSVHIGPYQLLADGLGADQPLDVNVGTATSIDVQVTDANGTGIDITGATVSAKVYSSAGTLVATYSGTATYADNGRLTFGLTTTVTATSGTYTVLVTRTTGATDTQIFGPLRLYVRPV
jgi:hypothetical protein